MKPIILSVSGMSCGGCANSVRKILSKTLSVDDARIDVDLEAASARISAEPQPTDAQIAHAIDELDAHGYPAETVR